MVAVVLWGKLLVDQFLIQPVWSTVLGAVLVSTLVRSSNGKQRRTPRFAFAAASVFLGASLLAASASAAPSEGSAILRAAANFEVKHLTLSVTSGGNRVIGVKGNLVGEDFRATALVNETLEPGDRISGSFRLTSRKGSPTRLVLKPQGQIRLDTSKRNFMEALRANFHAQIGDHLHSAEGDSFALVSGLSIGDDSALSKETVERFKTLSLTHLTAVSGANCAIVLAGVTALLSALRTRRWVRNSVSLAALAAYVALVGPEPSVLRSALMAAIVLLGFTIGRKVAPQVTLAWSVILVLSFWPELAGSLGLALSVAATGAILFLSPKIYQRLLPKVGKWLAMALSVTLAAQLWCLPLLFQVQSGLPTFSILANLLAEPLVAPITILGLVAVMVATPFPVLGEVLLIFASAPAGLILQISRMADLPASNLWMPAGILGFVFITMLVAGLSLWIFTHRRGYLVLASGAVLLWVFGASSASAIYVSWPMPDWQVVNCDVGQGDALVIRSSNQIAVVDVGRENESIDACLTRLGVREIDLLVLTHFDADHVGGLAGAIGNRKVKLAMISPYKDERPFAKLTRDLLAERSEQVIKGECCSIGQLGTSQWQVLQPEPSAQESEDSNDASIAMRFEFQGFTLYTMADLGERGQMRAAAKHLALFSTRKPVVIKVSHHGSADQYPELIEHLHPKVALISVGVKNAYGHPTKRTLDLLDRSGAETFRTDEDGAIAITSRAGELVIALSSRG